ncbi:MAG: acyltransferase [Leptolyngbyaceae cyanobacterium bins.349]|nr:acyltransferase [Leptolyngbyaceae cyanobacterium bins.349]
MQSDSALSIQHTETEVPYSVQGEMEVKHQPTSQRIAWLEGVRMFAAVMILVYHAQLLITDYAYTPQPSGLLANARSLLVANNQLGLSPWLAIASLPGWFSFQFVDVFVLISGFSLVLSLKGQPLKTGSFLKQRCLRILFPFWTVVWLSYPVLWLVGTLTHSYIPDLWHFFAAATFPLLFDYSGELLLPISGPWWFVALILSFTLVFPFLWKRLQQWGAKNLFLASLAITLIYRTLAVYAFHGHPTYVISSTAANWFPFLALTAKLSTFVLGMIVAQAYLQRRGPLFWQPGTAMAIGLPIYLTGFICQFYALGWIVADLLTAIGLTLCCMVIFQALAKFANTRSILLWLGAHSYSYFLIHNFVVDRTLNLYVQNNLPHYYLALPWMILGTLLLAVFTDKLVPQFKQGLERLLKKLDTALTPSSSGWGRSMSKNL